MKAFTLLLCLTLALVNAPRFCSFNNQSDPLNGTWIPVRQEMAGNPVPPASLVPQTLILSDSNYSNLTYATVADKGVFTHADGKMDIYSRSGVNNGKHFTALYKLENDQLFICYNISGDRYPDDFDTKGKPRYFLSVFKRK